MLRKRELIDFTSLCSRCLVAGSVLCLFLAVLRVGLWYVLVAFSGNTHLLLGYLETLYSQIVPEKGKEITKVLKMKW